MGGSPLPAGKLDQNMFSQSGSSNIYGSTLVSSREQFKTEKYTKKYTIKINVWFNEKEEKEIVLFTYVLVLLCATTVLDGFDKFLDCFVT